ncbi:62e2f6fe-0ec7-4dce-aca7-a34ffb90d334 [Thermothielavioides terrestris]|uniref:62e2f6fe-0ec7-4dce-aca7-a34ffb90d334 n=1 Tax=Thermothielavioides terrestris TaxID=2587410 RepID=A0A3S4CAQ5_9PEZI|nr:62e2f6fe-0ec7-4dce-aca7-a34ffb90d334 [Thermothielavioides terrestris]
MSTPTDATKDLGSLL